MSGDDFAAWMRRHELSENAAADVLGIARRTVQGYKAASAVAVAAPSTPDPALLLALYRPRRAGRPAAA